MHWAVISGVSIDPVCLPIVGLQQGSGRPLTWTIQCSKAANLGRDPSYLSAIWEHSNDDGNKGGSHLDRFTAGIAEPTEMVGDQMIALHPRAGLTAGLGGQAGRRGKSR